jgi:hypothetical protein
MQRISNLKFWNKSLKIENPIELIYSTMLSFILFKFKRNIFVCKTITFIFWCNISNPTMRTGLHSSPCTQNRNARSWNLVQSELEDLKWHLIRINHYLIKVRWINLIQSKDWTINFDRVLGLQQYTSPAMYPVLSCEQIKEIRVG